MAADAYRDQADGLGDEGDADAEYVDEHSNVLSSEEVAQYEAAGYEFVDADQDDISHAEADAAAVEMLDWLDADPDEFAAIVAALPADQQKELITALQTLGVEVQ